MSCCVSGLKEIAVNFLDISFQIIEPRIQQHASVSKYIAKAHHLTQPCSSKGLTWMMVALLMKDVISVLTLLIQSTNWEIYLQVLKLGANYYKMHINKKQNIIHKILAPVSFRKNLLQRQKILHLCYNFIFAVYVYACTISL